jgi:uncharacterized protein YggE
MKYMLIALYTLLLACNQGDKPLQKLIKVSGEGKIRIKPNLVTLTIEVSFIRPGW